jgi:hypothetical protein
MLEPDDLDTSLRFDSGVSSFSPLFCLLKVSFGWSKLALEDGFEKASEDSDNSSSSLLGLLSLKREHSYQLVNSVEWTRLGINCFMQWRSLYAVETPHTTS